MAVLIDQAFLETEPVESDMVLEHIGTAVPVHVNFAIKQHGPGRARVAGGPASGTRTVSCWCGKKLQQALRNELKGTITALLLSCEMALQVPDLQSGAESRMRTVHELAQEMRAQARRPV